MPKNPGITNFHNWIIVNNPGIIGHFVTLFFPDLYTGPQYTDVGPNVAGQGLNETLEASGGTGTGE